MSDFWSNLLADLDKPGPASNSQGNELERMYREDELNTVREQALARNQGGVSRELESGWEQTKGSVARTVGEFTGWQGAKDYADERAAEAQGLSEGSGFTQSWDEVDGISSGASYVAKATLNTLPGIAAMAIPGYGAAALTGRAAVGLGAAAASNAAQQTGGNLDAQIAEGGETDLLSAGLAGVAQAGLDTFTGVGGRVLSGLRKPVTEVASDVSEGVLKRTGKKIVRTAAEEGVTEGTQQALQEAARSRVTPEGEEFDMTAAVKRVKESAITGALVGGVLGGALPSGTRRKVSPVPSAEPDTAGTDPTVTAAADAKAVGPEPGSLEAVAAENSANYERMVAEAEGEDTARTREFMMRQSSDPKAQPSLQGMAAPVAPPSAPPAPNTDPYAVDIDQLRVEIMAADKPQAVRQEAMKLADGAFNSVLKNIQAGDFDAAETALVTYEQELEIKSGRFTGKTVSYLDGVLLRLRDQIDTRRKLAADLEYQTASDSQLNAMTLPPTPEGNIGQATVDAQIATAQAAQAQAQQVQAEQAAADQQMLEGAVKQSEEFAKSQEEQQALQQEDNLRIANEQLQPAQRQELLDSVINGPTPQATPLRTFMQGLRKIDPNLQPTPEELSALAKYSSMSYADKAAQAEKVKPEKLVAKAPQNEALLEPVSVPAKTSKRQQRAMQARAEATALVPESQQPPEIKSMLKALEDAATSIDATFKSLLKSAPIEGEQMSLFPDEPRTLEGSKGFRKYVATKIAAQDAKFEQQLAEMQAAVAKLATPAPAPEPKQEALLDAKGKPTKAALRLTKDQVAEQVADMEKTIPNDGLGAAKKLAVVPEIKALIESAPGEAVVDLMATISRPDISMQDAVQLTQIVKDRFVPKAEPTPAPETPAPAQAVEEETDNAVFQEPDADPELPRIRRNPEDGDLIPTDVPRLERLVRTMTQGWRNAPRMVVFDLSNPRSLEEQEQVEEYYKQPYAAIYIPSAKTVYIPASYIPRTQAFLRGTIFHESLGHFGLDQAFGAQKDSILRDIGADRPDIMRASNRYYQSYLRDAQSKGIEPGLADRISRALAIEEALVNKWNNGDLTLTANLWGRLRDFVTKFARKMGMPARRYTNGEIIHMMHKARDAVIGADPSGTRRSLEESGQISKNLRVPMEDIIGRRRTEGVLNTADGLETFLLDKGVNPYFVNKATNIRDAIQRGRLGAMLGQTLIDYSKKLGLTNYERVAQIQQQARQIINEKNASVDQLMIDALRLDKTSSVITTGKTPRQDAMKKYMRDATYNGKWGYKPTWLNETITIDPKAKELADKYRKADPEGFKVADRLMEYAYKDRMEFQQAVRNFINGDADADLKEPKLTKAEIKQIEDRRSRQLKMFDKSVPKFDGPYFPLSRFGNYATVAKSAEYIALEKKPDQTSADRTALMEMRADENHYAVLFRDTLGDAQALKRELGTSFKGGEVYASTRTEAFEQMGESPLLQMQKLKQMVTDELGQTKLGRDSVRQIESMLKDLYVRTLADNSARKYDRKRENVAGADDNMLRSFSEKMRADANSLGYISTYNQEMAVTKSLYDEVNKNQTDPQFENRKRFLAEVIQRRAVIQTTYDSPWAGIQDKLMAVSSLYHLATSPRYYIMNAMQPMMFTAPLLAGRYGMSEAWSAMNGVYSKLAPQMKTAAFWKGEIDFDKLDLRPDQKEFLKAAQASGKLDFGAQLDAGFWQGDTGRFARAMSEANHMFRTTSSQVEFINRTVAGLAAYELSKSTQYGLDIIEQTQFNYSTESQPRFFNMAPRIMTQFRKYQIGQLALQGRLLKNALDINKQLTPEERRVARAQLGYMYGQLGVVAGALGLPGAQLVGWIGSALFGEDDEPIDGERWMRNLFGEGMGKYALRGVPTMVGLEMDGVGLGKLLNPLPYFDYGTLDTREGVRDFMFQAGLGAFGGLVDRAATKGVPAVMEGDAAGAADAFLPSGFRNALRGYMLAQEGLTKTNGDMLLKPDEVSLAEAFMQGTGFIPTEVKERQKKYYEKVAFEEYYKERSTEMKRGWVQATKDNDAGAMRELEGEWRRVQEAKVRLGIKPAPLSQLYAAKLEQAKRQKKLDDMPVGFR